MRAALSEFLATSSGSIGAFKAVRHTGTSGQVEAAIADGNEKRVAGFSTYSSTDGNEVVVCATGLLGGFSGLTPGNHYYLSQSTAGEITSTRPTTGEVQLVGVAMTSTILSIVVQIELSNTVGGNPYGGGYQRGTSEGESSTTSDVYQEKLTFTTTTLPAGTYRVVWSMEVGNANKSQITEYRFRIGSTTVNEGGYEVNFTPHYIPVGGAGLTTLASSGTITSDLYYRRPVGGTAQVRRARIEVWRVS